MYHIYCLEISRQRTTLQSGTLVLSWKLKNNIERKEHIYIYIYSMHELDSNFSSHPNKPF